MVEKRITEAQIGAYERYLRREERAGATVEKYLRAVRGFARWLAGKPVTKENAAAWKASLVAQGLAPATVNGALAALNGFFRFRGWGDQRVKFLKLQRRTCRDRGRELDRGAYARLVRAAEAQGRHRLALVMETICGTGIRVSEVRYITVEAVGAGVAQIAMKGKVRTILLPQKLCRRLVKYAKMKKIASGEIFLTRDGKSLSRKCIWTEMKKLCGLAGVAGSKVFPHNLRHVFARTFYQVCRDVVRLADVLGHSSIDTTRIYLLTTGKEYARQLDRLGLLC